MASIGYAVPNFARRRIGARNDENDDDDVANTMVAPGRLLCEPRLEPLVRESDGAVDANKCPAKATRLFCSK